MSRRALIIAYDFPPHGAIGTMRTLRLVRHLDQEGWQVTVLTGSPETYLAGTPIERGTEARVPPGVELLQVRAIRPYVALEATIRRLWGRPPGKPASPGQSEEANPTTGSLTRTGSWRTRWLVRLRDNFEALLDTPDKESGWIFPAAVRGIMHMIRHGRPQVIYSSGPPWSGQVIALALQAISRRPWIADFRDPWARAPWRDWRVSLRRRIVAWLERRTVTTADAVLFVTEGNHADFASTYGIKASRRFHVVPNGCDPTELDTLTPFAPREQFVLLHAGTFYGPRTPMPVIEAIASAVKRGALDRTRFRLRLVGSINIALDVPAECVRLGIEDVVEFVPRVTRAESLREMKSASALLLVQIATTVSIPAKAYEYLAAGRPVLALSEEGDTAALVRASGLGISVTPDASIETIEAAVLEIIAVADRGYAPAPRALYDGRVHAETTRRLFDALIRQPGAPVTPAGVSVSTGESRQ